MQTVRVPVQPALFEWARSRAGISADDMVAAVPAYAAWASGERQPTLRQLQDFAARTHAPFGQLLLTEPPAPEAIPVPDFRTFQGTPPHQPTPDLLDTIYLCEERQEWFRSYAQQEQLDPVPYFGQASTQDDPDVVAGEIRELIDYGLDERAALGSWTEALSVLRDRIEDTGPLVMVSGVVGSNSHRTLNPQEFRGFTLADPLSTVIFINGRDTKAAQIFTLAHELGHVALGESALGNPSLADGANTPAAEQWCNRFAAELLIPKSALIDQPFDPDGDVAAQLATLARRFRTSTLVVLGRLRDIGTIDGREFGTLYRAELDRVLDAPPAGSSGGDFYNTAPVRISKSLTRAILTSTLEGRTAHTEAFRLLGVRSEKAFDGLIERLGV